MSLKDFLHQTCDPLGKPSPLAILGLIMGILGISYAITLCILSFFQTVGDTHIHLMYAIFGISGIFLGGYVGEVFAKSSISK